MTSNKFLSEKAKDTRKEIIRFKTNTGSGHLASSLSLVDALVSLYYDEETFFNHKLEKIVFGKAHGGPAVYPILADLKYFPLLELERYCKPDGILRLHPDQTIPGCEFVGGSLGNAIGYAAGLAWADRGKTIITVLGDAELYEGSVWESLLFIAHNKLNNLVSVVDRNGLGILGETEVLLKLEPLSEKFTSFGFEVLTADGHNFDSLRKVFQTLPTKPTVIILNTIKSKGVQFMEGKAEYHTIIPRDQDVIKKMLEDLN
jgi:transketolase